MCEVKFFFYFYFLYKNIKKIVLSPQKFVAWRAWGDENMKKRFARTI